MDDHAYDFNSRFASLYPVGSTARFPRNYRAENRKRRGHRESEDDSRAISGRMVPTGAALDAGRRLGFSDSLGRGSMRFASLSNSTIFVLKNRRQHNYPIEFYPITRGKQERTTIFRRRFDWSKSMRRNEAQDREIVFRLFVNVIRASPYRPDSSIVVETRLASSRAPLRPPSFSPFSRSSLYFIDWPTCLKASKKYTILLDTAFTTLYATTGVFASYLSDTRTIIIYFKF